MHAHLTSTPQFVALDAAKAHAGEDVGDGENVFTALKDAKGKDDLELWFGNVYDLVVEGYPPESVLRLLEAKPSFSYFQTRVKAYRT